MLHLKNVRGFAVDIILATSACSTATIEQVNYSVTPNNLNDGEAIVILTNEKSSSDETEESFKECLYDELKDGNANLAVFASDQFRDELFPWFEPRTAPTSHRALLQLMYQPGVRQKITETKVRYVVWLNGDTDQVDQGGTMACSVTPFGIGCFGLAWWDKESVYEAAIWDLKLTQAVGKISAEVSGTSYLPALIIPIPLIARTQNTACEGLAAQVKDLMGISP